MLNLQVESPYQDDIERDQANPHLLPAVTHSTERQRSKSPARRTTTSPKRVTFSDGSERDTKFIRAAFYAVQVFYSFLIMYVSPLPVVSPRASIGM